MTPQERGDFEKLSDLYAAKRLHASISYVEPWQFYLGFTAIVGCYLFMGGMTGTARNEILQGILIVTFSVLLIPFGFHALGAEAIAAWRCCASVCQGKCSNCSARQAAVS